MHPPFVACARRVVDCQEHAVFVGQAVAGRRWGFAWVAGVPGRPPPLRAWRRTQGGAASKTSSWGQLLESRCFAVSRGPRRPTQGGAASQDLINTFRNSLRGRLPPLGTCLASKLLSDAELSDSGQLNGGAPPSCNLGEPKTPQNTHLF